MAEEEGEASSPPARRSLSAFQRCSERRWTGTETGRPLRGEQRTVLGPPEARAPAQPEALLPPEPVGGRPSYSSPSPLPGPDPPPPPPGGSRASRSFSPSVRQLSQRFDAARDGHQAFGCRPPPPAGCCSRSRRRRSPPAADEADGGRGGVEPPGPPPPSPGLRRLLLLSPPPAPPPAVQAPDWPSVTEMRKLFGESFRRQPLAARASEPRDDDEAPDSGGGGDDDNGALDRAGQGREAAAPPPPLRRGRGARVALGDEDRRGTTTPPPPPPRSCIPFPGLRRPLSRGAAAAPSPSPPDGWEGPHSWHSSASRRGPSGGQEAAAGAVGVGPEERLRPGAKGSPDRSSGSEEESQPGPPRRCSNHRKMKKREPGFWDQAWEGEGLAGLEWHLKAQEEVDQGIIWTVTDERTRMSPAAQLPPDCGGGSEGLRVQGSTWAPGGPRPLSSAAASPLPLVSRVSKVTIPPLGPRSPCGSQSSSRYSSTETLKEEDHYGTSWGGPSRSLGVFRSPSFNQSASLAKLQAQIRGRPKLPPGMVRMKQDLPSFENLQGLEAGRRSEYRKSMSNPDIATETLALLGFLKSDLLDLKARKKGVPPSEQEEVGFSSGRYERYHPSLSRYPSVSRTESQVQPSNLRALGGRPTLKDLTATLRRAKSFTYSDKPSPRRLFHQNTMKQSSSELLLSTLAGDHECTVSNQEVGQGGVEDGMPVVVQDQYIQEARQVFEKISKIGSQHDYNFASEQKDRASVTIGGDQDEAPESSYDRPLSKAGLEGNFPCRKSLEELSGPESSMTDEGIVTEPETGPTYSYLSSSVAAWKPVAQRGDQASCLELGESLLPSHTTTTSSEKPTVGEEALPNNKMASHALLEAPLTPSALRRRRKFPSVGDNGSESSNGSNGEANGETYRSLSDPMPHRRCSVAGDVKNFSVDSNLLGSLNPKTGLPESSAAALSECMGSAASDLSVCSDGLNDYNTMIQNIVSQPGAMDKVIDEKGNGKTIKKKSFSDPSRRGELASVGFDGPGEPISEMDQSIPPSSSEPILSEPRGQRTEREEMGTLHTLSEHGLLLPPEEDGTDVAQNYSFDPKLAEVLSPRIIRRSSKKRNNRVNCQQEGRREETTPSPAMPTTLSTAKPASKHVRHTSEPATFIPISDPSLPPPMSQKAHMATPELPRLPLKPYPVLQAPSLDDVSKHYMLAFGSGEQPSTSPVDTSRPSPATPTVPEPKLPRCPKHHEDPSTSITRSKPQVDMRKHVIMTLLDTEQSYVESLRTLMLGYMKPLKQPENSILCDPSLVDEIFDQIPELLEHHEEFLEQISECMHNWHEKQKVGDILVQSFSKDNLVSIYSAYIDNFLNAKDAVRIAKEARPAFMKFLEQSMRENKEKQALSDLMIKPVQRIPRYELLVKDLLKHTSEDHPDHPFLLEAQKSIKQVAERINKGMKSAEEVERNARIVQEIESHIEGMEDLQAPLRRFLRQEMVVEMKAVGGKKERSLFLFSDLLVCTTLKRKSGSLRRSSMSLYTAASVIDTASKYKLLWKMPLEDVDIVKGASQSTNRESIQKAISRLDEDLSTLGQVSKLSETLSFSHQSLDDVLKDLMAALHRELAEKQSLSFAMSFPPNKMELTVTKADSTESFIFEFPNPDARHSFEQAFEDTKKKLASSKNCLDPEFLKAIPIMKTRSGMQFSCASPSHSNPESAYEVWVCNSDGYVGQVCLLSIKKEPIVEACIAVCSARILCISSVPGLKRMYREHPSSLASPSSEPVHAMLDESVPQQCLHISISGSSLELSEPMDNTSRELVPFDSDDTDDESSPSPSGTLQSQASHSTISSSFGNEEIPSSKDATAETTSSEEEQDPAGFLPIATTFAQSRNSESPMDGRAMRRSSRGSFTRGSLEDLLSLDPEAYQSSMWLGTEDGCIHVYQSSDNIRNRKNSMKMQHSASVTCILYLENQVFVSLANGELVVYQREAGRFWDAQNSKGLSLGSPGSPVTKMVSVGRKLWCGCQNRVIVLSPSTLQQEHTFQVGQDCTRSVTCMVSSIMGVWVTLQGSAQVRLYHPASYDQLAEVDITPPVHKMLAGSDAIIRQHKAACLRITALLACKDLLWIGTSAGVVLTLSITANTTSLKSPPVPVGLSQGHTGHVRFLTSIELPEGFDILFPLPSDPGTEKPSDLEKKDSMRQLRASKSKMLVISGGDGYEDFRITSSSETVGRDDSTNHLLLWRV